MKTNLVAVCRQLVERVLDLRANGLRGKEQHLLVGVRVQYLIGDEPGVHGLLELVQPLFGRATLLFVLCAVECSGRLDHQLFNRFQFHL